MNQDNAEMNLNKCYITFDCHSRGPKAKPRLSDVEGLEDSKEAQETGHLKQLVLRYEINGIL